MPLSLSNPILKSLLPNPQPTISLFNSHCFPVGLPCLSHNNTRPDSSPDNILFPLFEKAMQDTSVLWPLDRLASILRSDFRRTSTPLSEFGTANTVLSGLQEMDLVSELELLFTFNNCRLSASIN